MRILVVDDTKFMRDKLCDILEKHGFSVVAELSNGEEAIIGYIQHKPDLLIINKTMPVMDGIKAVEVIKVYDEKSKIIMTSGIKKVKSMAEAMSVGVTEYITTPFKEEDIINLVEKINRKSLEKV